MRTIKPIIGTLLAAAIIVSPVGTSVVFAAQEDVVAETTVTEACEAAPTEVSETAAAETSEAAPAEASEAAPAESTETITSEATETSAASDITGGEASYTEPENNISNSCVGTISNNTTVIVRGVPEADMQETVDVIDEYLPKIMETGTPLNYTNPGFVDAEKFNVDETGYDSNHCWAATASNILWTTGYAQKAINPMTGEAFKSEDEVLTYYSENFTDDPGTPKEAIEWFFNGTYTLNSVEGVAHTKSDESKGLLPGEKHDSFMVSVFDDAREMKKTYDIASHGMGVLIRWLKKDANGNNVLSSNAHWVTANGIAMDNEQESVYDKIKAIIIADSDNSSANGDLSATAEEKTAAKSEQKNIYTVYKLTFNEALGVWGINNFYNGFGVITHLYGLKDSDKVATGSSQSNTENACGGSAKNVPAEVQNYVDMINRGEIKVDTTGNELYVVVENTNNTAAQDGASVDEVEKMIIGTFTDKDLMKKDNLDMLREYMIKNNMSAFMVNDGKVDAAKDCTVYVNALDTMIYNVTVDGDAVPFKSYKIVDTKANIAKIVIEKNYMSKLADGAHTVQISVENWESPVEIEMEMAR